MQQINERLTVSQSMCGCKITIEHSNGLNVQYIQITKQEAKELANALYFMATRPGHVRRPEQKGGGNARKSQVISGRRPD